MPADEGTQVVSVKYGDAVDSIVVNTRHEDTRPKGIYKGGYIEITTPATSVISLSALVCEIGDGSYQVRVETTAAVAKTLAEGVTEYLVLRWTYAGAVSDYMEILVVATPAANDLIVGKGVWTAGDLTSILYTERSTPDQHRYFLKVEPDETPGSSVRVRPGVAHTGSGFIAIIDQTLDLSEYSSGNEIYIYLTDTGGLIHSKIVSDYVGKALLAKVTYPGDSIINADDIEDARSFIDSPAIPDNVTIERNSSTGKLQVITKTTGFWQHSGAALNGGNAVTVSSAGTYYNVDTGIGGYALCYIKCQNTSNDISFLNARTNGESGDWDIGPTGHAQSCLGLAVDNDEFGVIVVETDSGGLFEFTADTNGDTWKFWLMGYVG